MIYYVGKQHIEYFYSSDDEWTGLVLDAGEPVFALTEPFVPHSRLGRPVVRALCRYGVGLVNFASLTKRLQ